MNEKYEVVRRLGAGGTSSVYLVWDTHLLKYWAMKEIKKSSCRARGLDEVHILSEVNILKDLEHPSLPKIIDFFETEKAYCLVMDYIEGETFAHLLLRTGAQSEMKVIEWAIQLCDLLNYLHAQQPAIVFRDMKPSNMLLCPNGQVKLVDFGIARVYKSNRSEDTVFLGTRGFAAPEQFGGSGQTDVRTDIFGLGATMYQLLTGHHPNEAFYGKLSVRKRKPLVSFSLETIVLRATAECPEHRFASAVEMKKALLAIQQSEEKKSVSPVRRKYAKRLFKISVFAVLLFSGYLAKESILAGVQEVWEVFDWRRIDGFMKEAEGWLEDWTKRKSVG